MSIFDIFGKKRETSSELPKESLPHHVAFIMDGNGRWAKKRGLARTFGHAKGAETFKRVVTDCFELGIETVTVYAFSTENWKRPKEEVDVIMELLDKYIDEIDDYSAKTCAKVVFIGGLEPFSEERRKRIEGVVQKTSKETEHTLNVALNYGGRDELCRAFSALAERGATKVTEDDISHELFTKNSPDPEIIIRTGGESRLSNFLIWQSAYSELFFTDTLWPDFDKRELVGILRRYAGIERRFGGIK